MGEHTDRRVAPGAWTTGTVAELTREGRVVRLRLDVAEPFAHRAGQHCVLRLRAEDGYTAQRSYSIASAPDDDRLELCVEALPDGEVSGHLHDEARVGDVVELRGPVGRWFTWGGRTPSIAVVGGSGVVPVVAMVRHAARLGVLERLRVVAVTRTLAELPYADELLAHGAFVATTRENLGGRVAATPYPDEVAPLVEGVERAYVCGSPGFASYAVRLLAETGVRSDVVRVEQFGPTG
ncbi:ferredoxin reductase [Nocardioides lentus]|uniref:Ferredoxin reductase n=1 Tax=Nocardioides lentus TaxID=338077 RepID=A0ABN2PKN1_9ACTN